MKIYSLIGDSDSTGHPAGQRRHVSLVDDQRFCVKYVDGCATWVDISSTTKKKQILNLSEQVLFAVKTCEQYHKERLPIIFQTWGKAALNIRYFSDVAQTKYRTKVLPEVYMNTKSGHCLKTHAILKYFDKHARSKGWKWLIIVDDDTILGVISLV